MTDTTTITIDETETENYGLTDIPMAPCMNVEVIDRPRSYDVRPQYKTMGAAGMDLVADIEAPITIGPGETVTVGSGIKVALPNRYLVGLVFPKSGLGANEGLVLGNGVGVIDSDYRGEIKMAMGISVNP
jgi:deoxyuridine 5'-triphosphate nucleotidohydrolase